MAGPDRKSALLAQDAITGIDFVAIHADQVTLDVFLLHDPSQMVPPLVLGAGDVTITGDDEPAIPVVSAALVGPIDGREVLRVTAARPGDFGRYWLAVTHARIDPFFAQLEIDFKAACPRTIDCAPTDAERALSADDIRVDGSARDYLSLRRALLDFASARYPAWQDRLEADVGVMLVELMAAVGDELAYYQDRVARETQFGSASQRRSVRRHVQQVDYELHDGLGARAYLAVEVDPLAAGWQEIPAGTRVWASGDGAAGDAVRDAASEGGAIGFEVGDGLADALDGVTYRVHADRNELDAHVWDGDEPDAHAAHRPLPGPCLPVGATSLHVQGHRAALFSPGDRVFVVIEPPADARDVPARRALVTLTAAADEDDPLGAALGTGTEVTRLTWQEPLPHTLNLAWTRVLGNAVPATAGITRETVFSIGPNLHERPSAVERTGPDGAIAFLHTLPTRGPAPTSPFPDDGLWRYLEDQDVVRLGDDPRAGVPELAVFEAAPPDFAPGLRWHWRPSRVGAISSLPQDRHVTLDDGTWARAVTYELAGGAFEHRDYLAGTGATIRFGDGEFGRVPPRGNADAGQEVFFRGYYRLGNGARGNVAADTLSHAEPTGALGWGDVDPALAFIASVHNPLPAAGGVAAETLDEAKRDAPQAFRAITYRAVRPEDFDEAAERLPWVQRAGTQFRWTGSWMTAFTAADARSHSELPDDSRRALAEHLDRFRMAGREVHVLSPRYADLHLAITICVEPFAYPAEVRVAVARALHGAASGAFTGADPDAFAPAFPAAPAEVFREPFFHPDRFTFGTPLDRSALEAWVQRISGVRAIKRVQIARRGYFAARDFTEPQYQPGPAEIIRVDNDPRHPDRGSLTITTEGGA